MEDVFKIGKKLKHLREERKYTQEGVAIALGLKLSTYSDYEREISQVPSEVVVRATEYYKVSLDYFYSLRGPVNITMNDQSSHGYVENQHGADPSFMERMNMHMEERTTQFQVFMAKAIELLERMGQGGGQGN